MKYSQSKNSHQVYSTDKGRIAAPSESKTAKIDDSNNQITLIRDTKKRAGKTVIVIEGCPTTKQATLLKALKRKCASGGSIQGATLEIQGDHLQKIKSHFEQLNFNVKQSGR